MAIDFKHDDHSVTVVKYVSFMELVKGFALWALFVIYPVRWLYLAFQTGTLSLDPGLIYIDAGVLYVDTPVFQANAPEFVWTAVGLLALIVLLYQTIWDRREIWTFTAGRVDLTVRSRFGARHHVWQEARVMEIRLFISKSARGNTYWLHLLLCGGKVVRLPLMGDRVNVDVVAQRLEDMFPGAKTNRFDIGLTWED